MTAAAPAAALSGGFAEAAHDAARAFRAALEAMARPGRIERIAGAAPPEPLSPAMGALILTLCDPDTPLHLAGEADRDDVRAWVGFHTGAPAAAPGRCRFAAGPWEALLPLAAYPVGTPERPDRSATLIAAVPELEPRGARLTGPGIEREARLSLPDALVAARAALGAPYPLGLDWFACCGDRLAALPRTTEIA